ncbi:MAG: DUF1697 domain-containing protein [Erysipelotrichaceae bacterium]
MNSILNRYVVLLRGINVGGNNIISMKVLKEQLSEYGFYDVETYINSGNILLKSSINRKDEVSIVIKKIIFEKFNLIITVCVITVDELLEMKQRSPGWWNLDKNSRYNALFVIPPMTSENVMNQIGELNPVIEQCEFIDHILFWEVKNDYYSKSKYSKMLGKSYYPSLTIRNANTFNKLVELCQK